MKYLKQLFSNQRGYSLLEISIAMTLTTGMIYLAFYMFQKGNESSVYGMNAGIRTNVVKLINTMMNQAMSAPTQRGFNPALTLVPSGANYVFAGTWEMGPPPGQPPTSTIPSALQPVLTFSVGGNTLSQDSFLLEAYRLGKDATGVPEKSTLHALISRCIDGKQDINYQSIATILTLRKPIVINNQLHCCADLAACPSEDSSSKQYWPTIFVYKGENQITTIPVRSEREVVVGAGFFANFNRVRNADQVTYTAFLLENRCKLTKLGFGARSPAGCARTLPGYTNDSTFNSDIFYQLIMNQSRPTASDLSGSGFMKM
jgi:hypothetical protein